MRNRLPTGQFKSLSILSLLLAVVFCYNSLFSINPPRISEQNEWYLPVSSTHRKDISTLRLTAIGRFGLMRKARAGIPAHFHTGIDICRPNKNYQHEPVFPAAEGIIISIRAEGPYSSVIIEHPFGKDKIWTVYEHISAICVKPGDKVNPQKPFAYFMDKNELQKYGWKFDHIHFEILKVKPVRLAPSQKNPYRLYNSFTLVCYTQTELTRYFYHPVEFFKSAGLGF